MWHCVKVIPQRLAEDSQRFTKEFLSNKKFAESASAFAESLCVLVEKQNSVNLSEPQRVSVL